MDNFNIEDIYRKRKEDLTFEIYFFDDVQYNFKLEDMEKLLGISEENLYTFKKYLIYLDIYRVNYQFALSLQECINNFSMVVKDDKDKNELVDMFCKHENLFCDEYHIKQKSLIPSEYNNRIFKGIL